MSKSPFGKGAASSPIGKATPNTLQPIRNSAGQFMTPAAAPLRQATAISKQDIDMLGTDLQNRVGQTSNRIIDSITTAKFGDIGSILVQVQNTSEKLDPNKQFKGVSGWIRSKFVDVKSYLKQEFVSAGKVFDQLVGDLTKHIAMHDNWVKNLELIFEENSQNYSDLVQLIAKAETWKSALEQQVASFPAIAPDDPDALIKAQDKADLEALVMRVDQKIDTFKRLKMICENNAPKIRGQQRTSDNNKSVLRDIIDFTIPTLRVEFALYMQSLDSMSSQQLIENARVAAQKTMIKSANAASDAAIASAKSLNAPAIDNPTLEHLREKILFTVSEVKRIEHDAANQRQADAASMSASTQKFINQLTN